MAFSNIMEFSNSQFPGGIINIPAPLACPVDAAIRILLFPIAIQPHNKPIYMEVLCEFLQKLIEGNKINGPGNDNLLIFRSKFTVEDITAIVQRDLSAVFRHTWIGVRFAGCDNVFFLHTHNGNLIILFA